MTTQKIRTIYTISLVILDAVLVSAAFVLAYLIRQAVPWPDELVLIVPLTEYAGIWVIQVIAVIAAFFFY